MADHPDSHWLRLACVEAQRGAREIWTIDRYRRWSGEDYAQARALYRAYLTALTYERFAPLFETADQQ